MYLGFFRNQIDLAKEDFAKNREQMNKFCQENGFVDWFETSAKDNINIDRASMCLVNKILETVKPAEAEKPQQSIKLSSNASAQTQAKTDGDSCSC
jgi:hypothetical protein